MRNPLDRLRRLLGKKTAPPKTVKFTAAGLSATLKGERFLALNSHDPFIAQHGNLIIPAHRLIRRVWRTIGETPVMDEKTGITVQRAATGRYKGQLNSGTFKVTFGGRQFFVKLFRQAEGWRILRGVEKVDNLLQQSNYKLQGLKVMPIKPHIIYDRGRRSGVLVSDFFGEGEVVQVAGMPRGEKKARIKRAMEELHMKMEENSVVVSGLNEVNAFFLPAENTVLLYDLEYAGI